MNFGETARYTNYGNELQGQKRFNKMENIKSNCGTQSCDL